jgi:hypothetical protein
MELSGFDIITSFLILMECSEGAVSPFNDIMRIYVATFAIWLSRLRLRLRYETRMRSKDVDLIS